MSLPEETEDNMPSHDAYIESRSTLINKLVEFSIGTQSNTSEEVQRVAFKQLMNIHVLFSQHGSPDPLLVLELDDEVQIKCGEWIEREVEKFAEEIEELTEDEERASQREGSEEEDMQTIKKRKKVTNGSSKPENGAHYSSLLTRPFQLNLVCRRPTHAPRTPTPLQRPHQLLRPRHNNRRRPPQTRQSHLRALRPTGQDVRYGEREGVDGVCQGFGTV